MNDRSEYPDEMREWIHDFEEIADLCDASAALPDRDRACELLDSVRGRLDAEGFGNEFLFAELLLLGYSENRAAEGARCASALETLRNRRPLSDLPVDDLLDVHVAAERVAAVPIDRAVFPHDPPVEFKEAATAFLDAVRRARHVAEGGEPDSLEDDTVEEPEFLVERFDVEELVTEFYAQRDQARYVACRAVQDWMQARPGSRGNSRAAS
jgi:hypothetical protein